MRRARLVVSGLALSASALIGIAMHEGYFFRYSAAASIRARRSARGVSPSTREPRIISTSQGTDAAFLSAVTDAAAMTVAQWSKNAASIAEIIYKAVKKAPSFLR